MFPFIHCKYVSISNVLFNIKGKLKVSYVWVINFLMRKLITLRRDNVIMFWEVNLKLTSKFDAQPFRHRGSDRDISGPHWVRVPKSKISTC